MLLGCLQWGHSFYTQSVKFLLKIHHVYQARAYAEKHKGIRTEPLPLITSIHHGKTVETIHRTKQWMKEVKANSPVKW